MIPIFDSNIIIDIIRGCDKAVAEMERYDFSAISMITWIEVMAGTKNEIEEKNLATFLQRFEIIVPDMTMACIASTLRKTHRLKLPDAIIWATAKSRNTLLVTRNSKDFPASMPEIRIPYTV